MGAAEHPHHRALQHGAHVLHHVQNARVGAAHKNGQALGGVHGHADLVAEIVGHKALRRLAHKALRDGLKAVAPGEAPHQPQAGEGLGQGLHHPVLHAVLRQEFRPEAGGEVGVAQSVKGELRLKEMGAGVEDFAPQPLLQQVAEAGGVVIVAEHHSVQPAHTQAQPVGVGPGVGPRAAVKENAEIRPLQQIGQAVLVDQRLVLRCVVVHQSCDTYHFQPPPSLTPSLCFVQYRYIPSAFFLLLQTL